MQNDKTDAVDRCGREEHRVELDSAGCANGQPACDRRRIPQLHATRFASRTLNH
jgi:hypothetical protein